MCIKYACLRAAAWAAVRCPLLLLDIHTGPQHVHVTHRAFCLSSASATLHLKVAAGPELLHTESCWRAAPPPHRFSTANTQRLMHEVLGPGEQASLPYDLASIDWSNYATHVHVPGFVKYVVEPHRAAKQAARAGKRAGTRG